MLLLEGPMLIDMTIPLDDFVSEDGAEVVGVPSEWWVAPSIVMADEAETEDEDSEDDDFEWDDDDDETEEGEEELVEGDLEEVTSDDDDLLDDDDDDL